MKRFPIVFVLSMCLVTSGISQISIIGELSQDREASPGDQYEGTIVVRNETAEPQEVKAYQTDYLFHYSGTNNYGEPGSQPRSNAGWVRFSPSYLVVPPLSTMSVDYTVSVPTSIAGNPLIGSYWSMLMIESIPKGSPESALADERERAKMGIRQTLRYGIQIATHIRNTGKKMIEFLDVKLVKDVKGTAVLQIDLKNTGDVFIRPDVFVELFDAGGASKGKYPGSKYRMYPGTSVRQSIDLSNIPRGTYKALVVVDTGGEDIFGGQYTLTF